MMSTNGPESMTALTRSGRMLVAAPTTCRRYRPKASPLLDVDLCHQKLRQSMKSYLVILFIATAFAPAFTHSPRPSWRGVDHSLSSSGSVRGERRRNRSPYIRTDSSSGADPRGGTVR